MDQGQEEYLRVIQDYFPGQEDAFLTGGGRELHAHDIYQGSGFFRSWEPENRYGLLHRILDVVTGLELPVLGLYADKSQAATILGRYPPGVDLRRILFFVMCANLEVHIRRSRGPRRTLLAGDIGSIDQDFADEVARIIGNRPVPNILESVQLTDSHRSFGVQLADVIGYFATRHLGRSAARNDFFDRLNTEIGLTFGPSPGNRGMFLGSGGWRPK